MKQWWLILKINIDLIVVGNLKEKPMKMLCDEYLKRLQAYSKVSVIELKDESNNQDEKTIECLKFMVCTFILCEFW